MRITCTNVIMKPPELVFPWIAEPDEAMVWQRNVKGTEIIVNSPEVVGTSFRETIEEDGNSLVMQGVVTRFIGDRLIEFHLESRIHKLDVSYALEESDKATRITVDARVAWKFPMNLLSIFIGKKMREGITQQMDSEILELKRICEGR